MFVQIRPFVEVLIGRQSYGKGAVQVLVLFPTYKRSLQ